MNCASSHLFICLFMKSPMWNLAPFTALVSKSLVGKTSGTISLFQYDVRRSNGGKVQIRLLWKTDFDCLQILFPIPPSLPRVANQEAMTMLHSTGFVTSLIIAAGVVFRSLARFSRLPIANLLRCFRARFSQFFLPTGRSHCCRSCCSPPSCSSPSLTSSSSRCLSPWSFSRSRTLFCSSPFCHFNCPVCNSKSYNFNDEAAILLLLLY